MSKYACDVHLIDGRSQVTFDNRSFTVARRDGARRTNSCPIELLVGALGS